MTSTSTKVIGVRVPLHEYMEILQTAADNKMTISDYALQLIYLNKAKPQGQIALELERKCSVLKQGNTDLKQEVESLKKSLKESEDKLEEANDRSFIGHQNAEELKQKLAACQKQLVPNKSLPYYERIEKEHAILAKLLVEKNGKSRAGYSSTVAEILEELRLINPV